MRGELNGHVGGDLLGTSSSRWTRRARRACVLLFFLLVCVAGAGGAAAKGSGPTSIAAGYGSVWIGTGNGDVLALPTSLSRIRRQLAGGPTEFVHGLTARYGALWILRDRVTRLEPGSSGARDVPGTASGSSITAGAGAVWVNDGSHTILRIDPERMRVQARIRVPGRAWGLAAGSRTVIVASVPSPGPVTGPQGVRLLRRLDPETNHLSPPLARFGCDVGIAVGSQAVWTLDACTGMLARRNPRTLQVERQTATHVLSQVPALGFGSIWLASRAGTLRIDPVTLHIRARIPERGLELSVGSGSIWALDTGAGRRPPTIRKIDPTTNRVVTTTTIFVPS